MSVSEQFPAGPLGPAGPTGPAEAVIPAAPIPRASVWTRRLIAEIARGRHVVLHGNVHDEAIWQRGFAPVGQVLDSVLTALGYRLIGRYDLLDGLRFAGPDGARRFADLISDAPPAGGTAARGDGGAGGGGNGGASQGTVPSDAAGAPGTSQGAAAPGASPGAGPDGAPLSRAAEARARMAESLATGAAAPAAYRQPRDALAAIRRGLAQDREPVAFVIDFAELLLLDPEHHDRTDRELLMLVKKAMMESVLARGAEVRNLLVIVAPDLTTVPPWLYRDEPFVRAVEVTLPQFDERLAYIGAQARRYYRPQRDDKEPVRVLATLTEGMALSELGGLRLTSQLEKVPLASARELVNRAVFGQRDDPWVRLAGRVPLAREILGGRVLGQSNAVNRVARALAGATQGIDFVADPFSVESRPKGVFFFAGPTGVGKTELCRALSSLVFEDETALIRFDMSTFAQEHSAERLTGAPPGYVGHDRGGELTNRVAARPFSVLLFDEIEKAHPSVFDKFLQILEDGRLTDGLGRTTYFSQTLIIFTSNLGATSIYERLRQDGPDRELPSPQEVAAHFEEAVREHFTASLNRPELLGRIGNGVVAFDLLRPEYVDAIAGKFLDQLTASAARAGVELDIELDGVFDAVRREMRRIESLALGGRQVRNVLDRMVRDPLIDALMASASRGGRYAVFVPRDEDTAVIIPAGSRSRPAAPGAGAAPPPQPSTRPVAPGAGPIPAPLITEGDPA